jgi:cell fate regulator YaaT (PSP1 superfamily)
MHLIEVAFKGNRKDFFLWEPDDAPPARAAVIVEADRGEDLGYVYAMDDLAEKRNAGVPHGYGHAGTRKKARRLATPDEVARAKELREQDEDARRKAAERVRANDLAMKLSDAEWQWDRKKLTLYFTAERRVDFRTLVRELASMFRTRIELKQIGVRDEAKRLDGIGRCGRQYCSSSWLPELRPVNLGVAKDQKLSLNPSQISGACGRLMCCLRYEHEFYVQSRKKFPKEGRAVRTSKGEEKVISNDIFRDRVTLRGLDGEFRTIALAELREEAEVAGAPLPMIPASLTTSSGDDESDAITGRGHELSDFIMEPEVEETYAPTISVTAEHIVPEPIAVAPVSFVVENVVDGVVTASPVEGDGAARDKRPHRRRGRRGGRRNRGGNRPPGAEGESAEESQDSGGGGSGGGGSESEDSE